MAEVRVPRADFEAGRFPPVCAVTGAPADGQVVCHFATPIGAKWLLLVLGVIPFVLVWAWTRRPITGEVPITEAVFVEARARSRQRARRASLLTLVAVVGGLLFSLTEPVIGATGPALGRTLSLACLAYWCWALVQVIHDRQIVRGHVDPDDGDIVLVDADPKFASAVDHSPVASG